MGGARGAQHPVLRVDEPKKTDARICWLDLVTLEGSFFCTTPKFQSHSYKSAPLATEHILGNAASPSFLSMDGLVEIFLTNRQIDE